MSSERALSNLSIAEAGRLFRSGEFASASSTGPRRPITQPGKRIPILIVVTRDRAPTDAVGSNRELCGQFDKEMAHGIFCRLEDICRTAGVECTPDV